MRFSNLHSPMPKEYISLGLLPNSATNDEVIRFPKLELSDLRNLECWLSSSSRPVSSEAKQFDTKTTRQSSVTTNHSLLDKRVRARTMSMNRFLSSLKGYNMAS